MPKQFLKILGSKTMIQLTIDRVQPLCEDNHIIIVGSEEHHALLTRYTSDRTIVVLEEPKGRNTAPCIGLAAMYLRKTGHAEALMIVLPADHYIADEERFRAVLRAGCELAGQGRIVTIGLLPTRPETGYGYLQRGAALGEIDKIPTYTVIRFVEKPRIESALQYLRSGDYFWNGGIFIVTAETILAELETHLPQVYQGLLKIEAAIGTEHFDSALRAAYKEFPSVSIDYGVMEKTTRSLVTVPGDFGWNDVGSWESLYDLRRQEGDEAGNIVLGDGLLLETTRSFIFNQTQQMVVALGLQEMIIVNTGDALFVAHLRQSQDVKKVIKELEERGIRSLL